MLPVSFVEDILSQIHASFDTSAVTEISFELNPDDVDAAYLNDLNQAGVNRLSIGIQSFWEDDLTWMHRAHSAQEALDIIPMARRAGFENFSVDLIFGLPDQPADHWRSNLQRILDFDVPHISTYGLTVEPGTVLHKEVERGKKQDVSDSNMAEAYLETIQTLTSAGYEHYEVSSFCKPGYRSNHNESYWHHQNYLGVGPAAHSLWVNESPSDPDKPATRWENVRSLKKYLAWESGTPPQSFTETISRQDMANEYIMLRLRTRDGLNLKTLSNQYDTILPAETLTRLTDEGLATLSENQLQLTDEGLLICNTVIEKLWQ